MTPFLVMLITFLIVILGIGPVMHVIELKLVWIVELLIHIPFGIGGFVIGATYPLLVITGLHHTYTMIETSLLANTGFNPVITLCAMYGFANVGTCLAFFAKSKKENVRQTAIGAMLSQLFGISEPVLFGIQLRYNLRPLILMLCTSGLGAAILSVLNIQSNSYGLAVLPSYLMYIYQGRQLLWYFSVSVFSVIVCFVLTYMFGIPKEITAADYEEDEIPQDDSTVDKEEEKKEEDFVSPVTGKVISIENVKDPTFAGKLLGDGFAVVPSNGIIKAPADGKVESVYDTGHAVGITTKKGTEFMIHVGIDTVELAGEGFEILVSNGQEVKQGDSLIQVDLEVLKRKQKDPTVMVIFTGGGQALEVTSESLIHACKERVCKVIS